MTTTTMFTIQNPHLPGAMNEPGYTKLAQALQAAYNQAALGKGKERHAARIAIMRVVEALVECGTVKKICVGKTSCVYFM